MDSLVITGNKDKLEALNLVNALYETYEGRSEVTEFIIRVFYSDGKIRSVNIAFSGADNFEIVGGTTDA